MMRRAWWIGGLAACGWLACGGSPPVGQPPGSVPPPGGEARAPTLPPASPSSPAAGALDRVTMGEDGCSSDDDCVAAWTYQCCGDCRPAPPFIARSRESETAAREQVDKECETEDHDCSVFTCPTVDPACRIAAVCRDGRCAVLSNAACGG